MTTTDTQVCQAASDAIDAIDIATKVLALAMQNLARLDCCASDDSESGIYFANELTKTISLLRQEQKRIRDLGIDRD